jgi:Phage integrase, N-terminal SAM-like domain
MSFKNSFTYDYEQYLIKDKKFKPITLHQYTNAVEMLFEHLKFKYKTSIVDPVNVKPSDIKGFLDEKLDKGISANTVNKYLSTLRTFFHYMWENNKVGIDPVVKIKYYKVESVGTKEFTFQTLLDISPKILKDGQYPLILKCIFILAMKGCRFSEYHFKKDDVIEYGEEVIINTKRRSIRLKGQESNIFMSFYINSQFDPGEYVFTTKRHNTGEFAPIEYDSLYLYMGYIRDDFKLPKSFKLDNIRMSYVYYNKKVNNYTVEQLASDLGIEQASAAALLKESIERFESE